MKRPFRLERECPRLIFPWRCCGESIPNTFNPQSLIMRLFAMCNQIVHWFSLYFCSLFKPYFRKKMHASWYCKQDCGIKAWYRKLRPSENPKTHGRHKNVVPQTQQRLQSLLSIHDLKKIFTLYGSYFDLSWSYWKARKKLFFHDDPQWTLKVNYPGMAYESSNDMVQSLLEGHVTEAKSYCRSWLHLPCKGTVKLLICLQTITVFERQMTKLIKKQLKNISFCMSKYLFFLWWRINKRLSDRRRSMNKKLEFKISDLDWQVSAIFPIFLWGFGKLDALGNYSQVMHFSPFDSG